LPGSFQQEILDSEYVEAITIKCFRLVVVLSLTFFSVKKEVNTRQVDTLTLFMAN